MRLRNAVKLKKKKRKIQAIILKSNIFNEEIIVLPFSKIKNRRKHLLPLS